MAKSINLYMEKTVKQTGSKFFFFERQEPWRQNAQSYSMNLGFQNTGNENVEGKFIHFSDKIFFIQHLIRINFHQNLKQKSSIARPVEFKIILATSDKKLDCVCLFSFFMLRTNFSIHVEIRKI